jgi:hypothetical protein
MKAMKHTALLLIAAGGLAPAADPPGRAPIAGSPVVEVKGTIEKVQITAGQGMPYLEVMHNGKQVKIYLGAMRYLMEQNFNPKAGAEVAARGYKMNEDVLAITVTLPAEGKTLKLRGENGWPVWRHGQHGAQHRHGQQKQ